MKNLIEKIKQKIQNHKSQKEEIHKNRLLFLDSMVVFNCQNTYHSPNRCSELNKITVIDNLNN
jgi:hypothetical protein